MASEFDLITRYFSRPAANAVLGIGDDAALIRPSAGMELAVSADMLVAGRHFFPDADPELLGHKSLAVNLSDLAAMGATPKWALLSIALPAADEPWLAAFSRGFFALADRHGVTLVGGDTTRGSLNLSVTILGEVPAGQALRRDTARVDDDVWVSGELGGAALGLRHLLGEVDLAEPERFACLSRLHAPAPRVALGQALCGIGRAGIDVSDGLLADLGHVLTSSGVGAEIELAALPAAVPVSARLSTALARACLLAGGDDYELCFTAGVDQRDAVLAAARASSTTVARIGRIVSGAGLAVLDPSGQPLAMEIAGFDHFAD